MTCEIDLENIKDVLVETRFTDIPTAIPKIDSNTSYTDFFENFLLKNKPCILSNVSINWPCSKDWLKSNTPNFSYLANKYKTLEGTISDCNKRNFNAHETKNMNFAEFIDYWQTFIANGYSSEMPLLYLKDLHLKKITGENFYLVPKYFSSDWLNEYFSEKTNDDYKFVYMGPTGTWTPFHADVFTSFSWSVNVCGKKKWILFPPGEEEFLKDSLDNLPYDVTECEHKQRYFEVIQNPGEAIFVPSGWHHQVWNLENTISINHNWINGCNIYTMWQSLSKNLEKVKDEISDCKDMDDWLVHCQLMLKTSYGLDFNMFYDFLQYIASKRIEMLTSNVEIKQFDTWVLGKCHALFDLKKIKEVLEMFVQHPDLNEINIIENNTLLPPNDLIAKIYNVLQNIYNKT